MINLKEIKDIPAVYCIENLIDKKIYIGSSEVAFTRLENHILSLRGNYHSNIHLQRTWNKHGESAFIVYILEYVKQLENETFEDFKYRLGDVDEQRYLDTLLYAQEYIQSNGKDDRFLKLGFNFNPRARNSIGRKSSDEQRQQQSIRSKLNWKNPKYREKQISNWTEERRKEASINRKEFAASNPEFREKHKQGIADSLTHLSKIKKRPVLAYDRFTGEFKKECESVTAMGVWIGVSKEQVGVVLKGRKRYTHDLVIKYKESENYPLQIEPVAQYADQEGRKKAMSKVHDKNSKTILQYDLNDKFIKEHKNAVEAVKTLGVGKYPSNLTGCATGKVMTAYGFTWKYKD